MNTTEEAIEKLNTLKETLRELYVLLTENKENSNKVDTNEKEEVIV